MLPRSYVREHLDLGYAVTAHRAQGITVDTAHVIVTATTNRENLYVAMARGRESNRAYVTIDDPDDTHTGTDAIHAPAGWSPSNNRQHRTFISVTVGTPGSPSGMLTLDTPGPGAI